MLAIVAATGSWLVGRADGGSAGPDAPPAATPVAAADAAEAAGRDLVDRLERAWRQDRPASFLASAATTGAARRYARDTWQALTALRVRDLELRWIASATPPPDAPRGSAAAVVQTRWTQRGWPGTARSRLVLLHDVGPAGDRAGGRLLGVDLRGDRPAPLWSLGPLRASTTSRGAIVVRLRGPSVRPDLRSLVTAADRDVRAALAGAGSRAAELIVVVPATATQFSELVGDRADYRNVAAVTATVDGSVRAGAPVQVLLNPTVFRRLGPIAAQVVLAHEATHVVTGATAASLPLWVAEGFADFVALRNGPVPVRVAAGRALAAVRRSGPPGRLPTATDFGTEAHGLGRAYEEAWLAFRVLAGEAGAPAVVDFYRSVLSGRSLDRALRRATGLDVDRLTRRWQVELVRLSDAGR